MRLRIKNWKQFQHYKDRCPPWIKLHFKMLHSRDWVYASDSERVLSIVCMIMASQDHENDGSFDADPEYFRRIAYLRYTPDFKPLITNGFLEMLADASGCKQMLTNAVPEKRREEKETEQKSEEDFLKAAKEIPVLCRQILGVEADKSATIWSRVKELEQDHGGFAVVNAFKRWAADHRLDNTKTPVLAFLSVHEDYLSSPTYADISSGGGRLGLDSSLDPLLAKLYAIGRHPFSGKLRTAIGDLLTNYSADDILGAWKEYTAPMDDNDLKFAPKKFCEGAAVAIILARREEAEKAQAQAIALEATLQREQAAAEVENVVEENEVEEGLGE
jgi:hypothetical protein